MQMSCCATYGKHFPTVEHVYAGAVGDGEM